MAHPSDATGGKKHTRDNPCRSRVMKDRRTADACPHTRNVGSHGMLLVVRVREDGEREDKAPPAVSRGR